MTSSLPSKDPNLLPTPSLSADEFEDFTERLLSAHRACAKPLRRVVRVERWGRRGDKQDGIDFEGTWSDGKTAAWQCKRYVKLTVAQVKKVVKDCTFQADEYYLVFSGEASPAVRVEMAKHSKWQLVDQRGLGRMLDDLPLHRQRQVLDQTWGVQKRKLLLQVSGEDALLAIENYALTRRDPNNLLNDLGPLVGRDDELQALKSATDRSADWPPVVLVTGPGGRGKSRLITHALEAYGEEHPTIPVLCLATGRQWDGDAVRELPHTPSVIWVDDAHRDPKSLGPLLNYARSTEGTQLVLASRGAGRDQVRSELVSFGVRLDQIQEVSVGELSIGQGRRLVRSLSEGIEVPFELAEHLAGQAVDSPHIAVLALNMARRGELGGPLALDRGLRGQVLLRYQTIITGDVEDFERAAVLRTLAVLSAVGPVDVGGSKIRSLLAEFCDLKPAAFLRLIERLEERGVLVTRSSLTRVTPDVLADQVLERECVVSGHDTGFASELWETFGAVCRIRLIVTLSELDWRLSSQGHPSIIAPVKSALHAEIAVAGLAELQDLLTKIESLSYTQPQLLIELLDVIRSRMAQKVEAGASSDAGTEDSGNALLVAAHLPPVGAKDVEHRLSKLYGQCASNAPELLEQALDALWALRRRDSRETNPHTEHPERVITDALASLGKLPDASFPSRIVARVNAWLAEQDEPTDITTPLFAFKPLLAKEGTRYVATSRREISIRPFLISPQWARPFRDAIRASLTSQGSGADLRRASAAVHLLGEALRPPMGMHGLEISQALIDSWEEDDLETLKAITTIANVTDSAVVRRLVRGQIEWTTAHSRSMNLRHASLVLLTFLDQLDDDDLAEALLGNVLGLQPSRRGSQAPTLDEFVAAGTAESQAEAKRTDAEREARRSQRISNLIAVRKREREDRLRRIAQSLTKDLEPLSIVDALDVSCREVVLVSPSGRPVPGLNAVLRTITTCRPELSRDLVLAITARPTGPLDEGLAVLLGAWESFDSVGLLAWLGAFQKQRLEVRLAVATVFRDSGWANRSESLAGVFSLGANDPDERVRGRFLEGSYELLRIDPVATVHFLFKSSVSPFSASTALQAAAEYDGITWGQSLDEASAESVLSLVKRAGWGDYTVQQIAAGIARRHPRVVLEHLMGYEHVYELPLELDGLAEAFDAAPAELASWLIEKAQLPLTRHAVLVASLAMSNGMSSPEAEAIGTEVDRLDIESLVTLVHLLSDVQIWALSQPSLARRLFLRADGQGDAADELRDGIKDAMRVKMISYMNGVSDELNQALAFANNCARDESVDALKTQYAEAARLMKEQQSAMRIRYEDDSE